MRRRTAISAREPHPDRGPGRRARDATPADPAAQPRGLERADGRVLGDVAQRRGQVEAHRALLVAIRWDSVVGGVDRTEHTLEPVHPVAEVPLHGAVGQLQPVRDLRDREVLEVPQDDAGAHPRRQPGERGDDVAPGVHAVPVVVGDLRGRHQVPQPQPASTAPVPVDVGRQHRLADVPLDRGRLPQPGLAREHRHQRVLDQLLRVGRVPGQQVAVAQQAPARGPARATPARPASPPGCPPRCSLRAGRWARHRP